ncbi:hypothetical protein SAMN05421833_11819 [Microbispora rosea]|uniref:Uncharacterized protein n=1 Tax=Microbispora rosea TaxID=58117 RepID=A0A1N7EI15_9ACTN|nr:hypothetical protein SAMN05421833_11819 [Microbispora rosea]
MNPPAAGQAGFERVSASFWSWRSINLVGAVLVSDLG